MCGANIKEHHGIVYNFYRVPKLKKNSRVEIKSWRATYVEQTSRQIRIQMAVFYP